MFAVKSVNGKMQYNMIELVMRYLIDTAIVLMKYAILCEYRFWNKAYRFFFHGTAMSQIMLNDHPNAASYATDSKINRYTMEL